MWQHTPIISAIKGNAGAEGMSHVQRKPRLHSEIVSSKSAWNIQQNTKYTKKIITAGAGEGDIYIHTQKQKFYVEMQILIKRPELFQKR